MRGSILQLPHYTFMAWYSVKKESTEVTLPFTLPMTSHLLYRLCNVEWWGECDDELKRMWKEMIVICFKALSKH